MTKEPRDLKNIGNLSVDELEYLQNALTRSVEHLLNQTKELDAAKRAAMIGMTADTAYAALGGDMAANAAKCAAIAGMTAGTAYAALGGEMAVNTAKRAALDSIASGIASLTINPNTSLAALLATIRYPASASHALSKDWQNVGNDLWKSWAAIKNEHK